MRSFRPLLLVAGGVAIVSGVAVAVAFSSSFQTWAVRRALQARPHLGLTVGAVSAGWSRVELRDVQIRREGWVATLPRIEAELPVIAAGRGQAIEVRRLLARGWRIEPAPVTGAPAGSASANPGPRTSANPEAGPAPETPAAQLVQAFAGVLTQLAGPVDFSLDGVELEGEVVLPANGGRLEVRLVGGGFRAAGEGKIDALVTAALAEPRVSAVRAKAVLTGRMATPRTFESLRFAFDATAQGTQFPAGVGLAGELSVRRSDGGEAYAVVLSTQTQEILRLAANLPAGAKRLTGEWKLNMRDRDVAPFALGGRLPRFTAAGQGRFDWDLATRGIDAGGQLTATAAGLEVVSPELEALGEVNLSGEFNLAERAGVYAVRKLAVALAAAQPVVTVTALQPFEFNPASGELRPTDPNRALVGTVLHGLPVAWTKPFLGKPQLVGGAVRGEFTALARGGGVLVRSTGPVTIDGVGFGLGGTRWLENVDLTFGTSVDYNPQGWQVEIAGLTARSGAVSWLELEARTGQLRGKNEPLKTTGRFTVPLAAALSQPGLAGRSSLTGGNAAVTFAASLGSIQEWRATVDLKNLQGAIDLKAVTLPAVTFEFRADRAADGKVAFRLPVFVTGGKSQSEFTVAGSLVPGQAALGRVEATLTGPQVVVQDLQLLAGALGPATPTPAPAGVPAAPWAGIEGSITLQLGQVVYGEEFRAREVTGRIELDAGKVRLEGGQAGLGEKGRASLSGALTFEPGRPRPFALDAAVALKEFDPGLLLRSGRRDLPLVVEGIFEVDSRVSGQATKLEELATGWSGEIRLASKGGVFRGLPARVQPVAADTGRIAGFIAAAGSALGGLTGRKEPAAIAGRPQAVAELAAGLQAIPFDQLSVVLTRDDALNTTLRDFALIAPEMRLTGHGTLLHRPDAGLLEESLAMEFRLRARGRQAELLRHLGVLDSMADDLGYASCSLPIRIGGTLGQPEVSDLNTRLAALALEKAGVTEKAGEFFNKIIGGGK